MSSAAQKKRKASYDDILNLPDNMVGEIIDGQLYTSPRPSPLHSLAEGGLSTEIIGPFQMAKGGGPGGWWILVEPEIHVGANPNVDVLVPDIAGWRRAVGYRQAKWQDVSNGHPSVSVRYDAPRLILSNPHEGEYSPTARWAVCPAQLRDAVVAAEAELEQFAEQITSAMPLDCEVDPRLMGRKLGGSA